MNLFLLLIWSFAGVFTFLSGEVTLLSYGCVWFALMLFLVERYLKERKER